MPAEKELVRTAVDPEPLTSAGREAVLLICRVDAQHEDGVRLKRLGICEGRRVQLVQTGDPLILRVVGCRVGVSRHLASHVWVQPCHDCPDPVQPQSGLAPAQGQTL